MGLGNIIATSLELIKSPDGQVMLISSDRSSYSDDGLVYIHPLFEIFTQSNDAIDVTSVTLSRLNSINAIDVT